MDEQRAEFEAWVKPIIGDNPTWRESGEGEFVRRAWQAATQRQQERITELGAQVQALSLDAGRYAYLSRQMGTICITDADENTGPVFKGAAADSHIDAAIARATHKEQT